MQANHAYGPLILGASGRIGRMWQRLWSDGHWPDAARPVWHGRGPGFDVQWDMIEPFRGALPPVRGVIVLAGRTTGDVTANGAIATAALDLARDHGLGPVVLCSSSAVYGRATTPQKEEADPAPANDYGHAKLQMERIAQSHSIPSCAVRIANVAGADMVLCNAALGPVTLDQFPNGDSPRRMYVGPVTLARIMLDLIAHAGPLPPVLNLAQPGIAAMSDLLDAAGADWTPRPAPDSALPELTLDLSRLARHVALDPATPQSLISEARLAGWEVAG